MQPSKFPALLAALFAAVLLGTVVDATLNLGDTFKGDISVFDDVDAVEFDAVAGARISVSVKAKKKTNLLPQIQVVDLSTGLDVVAPTSSGKKKVAVKKVEVPSTGTYQVLVSSTQATTGEYTLKTSEKLTKAVTKPTNTSGADTDAIQDTGFGAKPGYKLSGTIVSPKSSDAVPFNPTITGPVVEGDPVELTGFITKNAKGKFTIKDLILPDLGTYVLSVQNKGLSGVINTKLKVKKNKIKKQTHEEQ